ncbi:MAG: endonuclease III [Paludibacteraceae bacterium]|nr:endonuclease III [Paludibacteraceae bacterium]MBN2786909.1 endonuclease III [Paludibacteraceae bacterium]
MTKKERYKHIIAWFEKNMPVAESELHYSNPFELVIAVSLSAQCTDKRVNMVTPRLFQDFPTPEALAHASSEVVLDYIKSVSYPNNKAKNLVGMAKKLLTDFNGEVPRDIDLLQTLPGVGRKTANVVASVAFNINAMPVDTHVFRVSNRLGLTTNSTTPLATEKELVKYIPAHLLGKAHHWILLHGRYVCKARKPECEKCGLTQWCLYVTSEK